MTQKRNYIIPEVVVENYRTRECWMIPSVSNALNPAPRRVERRDPAF